MSMLRVIYVRMPMQNLEGMSGVELLISPRSGDSQRQEECSLSRAVSFKLLNLLVAMRKVNFEVALCSARPRSSCLLPQH
jgi:hypothetical protein